MVAALFRKLTPTVYLKLRPNLIYLRDVGSDVTLSEEPIAAISMRPRATLVAVGEAARLHASDPDVKIFNPFTHQRSPISDFTLAEQVIKGMVRKLLRGKRFAFSPVVIVHPQFELEGGITQVEIRALRELALGAGASRVIVWEGRELTDHELLSRQFDGGGQVLQ